MTNIALLGFMGTGKTAIGIRLAELLAWDFVDIDELIEIRNRMTIAEIFDKLGEKSFRLEESKAVADVSQSQYTVISTGGGVVLDHKNIENLKRSSLLVCLEADPGVILERVSYSSARPLLNNPDPLGTIKKLLEARKEHYKCADIYIDTSNKNLEDITKELLEIIFKQGVIHGNLQKG